MSRGIGLINQIQLSFYAFANNTSFILPKIKKNSLYLCKSQYTEILSSDSLFRLLFDLDCLIFDNKMQVDILLTRIAGLEYL